MCSQPGARVAAGRACSRVRWRWLAVLALQGFLGYVLLLAGIEKLHAGSGVVLVRLSSVRLLPMEWWTPWVAVGLPWVEVALGVWLVAGVWSRTAAAACAGLLGVFTLLLLRLGFNEGWGYECACHTPFPGLNTVGGGLVRNLILLGCCLVLVFLAHPRAMASAPSGVPLSATLRRSI